jgi:hypothetical protein
MLTCEKYEMNKYTASFWLGAVLSKPGPKRLKELNTKIAYAKQALLLEPMSI